MKLATYNENATAFELIPAGIYEVRCDDVKVVPKKPQYVEEGNDAHQWQWLFSINDGPQAGKTFKAWSNRTVNKGSTAKPWAEALMGRPFQDGEDFDNENVIGSTMTVYLSEHTTGQGVVVNRIKDVLSGPKPEHDPQEAISPEKGWPRRFSVAAQKITNANAWTREETRQWIAKKFPGYTEFSRLNTAQQKPVLDWIEAEAKNAPEPEGDF